MFNLEMVMKPSSVQILSMSRFFLFIYFFNKFIYLFLAELGLCCWARAFSSCSERGLLFVVVRRLLIAVASLVAEQRLQACGLQQLWLVGSRAQAQQLWCTGLVAPRHVGSSRTRAQARVPCIDRRFLNHCAIREAPEFSLLFGSKYFLISNLIYSLTQRLIRSMVLNFEMYVVFLVIFMPLSSSLIVLYSENIHCMILML